MGEEVGWGKEEGGWGREGGKNVSVNGILQPNACEN